MGFTEREFRNALGQFPTGVAIVTARKADGRRIGVTVNSFTSVSLNPPLISFNLAKSLGSMADWLAIDAFAINLRGEGQHEISNSFARANTDKWACTSCFDGLTASPILIPNLAAFECEKFACHEAGDHIIVLGKVLRFEVDAQAEPLVFHRGGYRKFGEVESCGGVQR
jgi:flavin reductase (DIM6/NTAB) family NADH-FMN oxidoreductase RutF